MTSNRQPYGGKSVQTKIPWLWIVVVSVLLVLTQFSMVHVPDRFVEGSGEASVLRRQVSIPVLGLLGAMFFVTAKGWRVRWHPPILAACAAMSTWIL